MNSTAAAAAISSAVGASPSPSGYPEELSELLRLFELSLAPDPDLSDAHDEVEPVEDADVDLSRLGLSDLLLRPRPLLSLRLDFVP